MFLFDQLKSVEETLKYHVEQIGKWHWLSVASRNKLIISRNITSGSVFRRGCTLSWQHISLHSYCFSVMHQIFARPHSATIFYRKVFKRAHARSYARIRLILLETLWFQSSFALRFCGVLTSLNLNILCYGIFTWSIKNQSVLI